MLSLSQPHPLTAIVESVSAKTPLGSTMRSAEWALMPAGLRDAAFFSASVETVRFLKTAQDGIGQIIGRVRATNDKGEGYWAQDRGRLLADLRQLGTALDIKRPDGRMDGQIIETDITDPLSVARLKLVINTQIELAYGKADWLTGMDPDLLEAFPAWELVRISPRRVPRDWPARWKAAGGAVRADGRMVALKTDPVWLRLSRFGNPHPPFDFNSGMGVEDIDRSEAEEMELLTPNSVLTPNIASHQEALRASLSGLQPPQVAALKKLLPRAVVRENEATREPELVQPLRLLPDPPKASEVRRAIAAAATTADTAPLPQPLRDLALIELGSDARTLTDLLALNGGREWWLKLLDAESLPA